MKLTSDVKQRTKERAPKQNRAHKPLYREEKIHRFLQGGKPVLLELKVMVTKKDKALHVEHRKKMVCLIIHVSFLIQGVKRRAGDAVNVNRAHKISLVDVTWLQRTIKLTWQISAWAKLLSRQRDWNFVVNTIFLQTVVCSVTWPLNGNEA